MKVFFSGSSRGIGHYSSLYKKIFKEIDSLGFTHLDDDLVTLTPTLVNQLVIDPKAYTVYTNKKIRCLQECDICVFEGSVPSMGLGFLIERALALSKPVVVLYYQTHKSMVIAGLMDEKLVVRHYQERNLKKVLKEALEQARQRRDRRFNFFINPKLLDYIEDSSRKQGITKSKFIRNLILEHMHRIHETQTPIWLLPLYYGLDFLNSVEVYIIGT